MKTALFIGRFQPFHNGHLADVKLALKECDNIIIAIGSSQEAGTEKNPFSYEQRKAMIKKVMQDGKIKNYEIAGIPDVKENSKWVDHVIATVKKRFDAVYTGNKLVKRLFAEKGFQVRDIVLIPDIDGTRIRKMLEKNIQWKVMVPDVIHDLIGRGLKKID